jgi:hypothetical protein
MEGFPLLLSIIISTQHPLITSNQLRAQTQAAYSGEADIAHSVGRSANIMGWLEKNIKMSQQRVNNY